MDIEFHYWMTGMIAVEAGFTTDEACCIAYSSQYVDENDVCYCIHDKSGGNNYYNFISQTMNILKPKNTLMRIYPIFHFIPGDPQARSARRRDGKMHILNTTPNSVAARNILQAALRVVDDTRLYRIGIASHAYVDTWAHQNFVGWYDQFNGIGDNLLPNIGHADARHHPDWPGHRWDDPRLVESEINNNHRFLSAAQCLFEHYCDALIAEQRYSPAERPHWEALLKKLTHCMGVVRSGNQNYNKTARQQCYQSYIKLPDFKESSWFDDAIDTDVRGLKDSEDGILSHFTVFRDQHSWREDKDKTGTHWFRFQQAVKAHERHAITELAPLFRQMGIQLAKA